MRLGLNLGYWGAGQDTDNLALARELGYLLGGALGHRKSNIAM